MPVIRALHAPRFVMIVSAFLLCAMSGCDSSQNDIVGKWRSASDAMVWEFSPDSSVVMDGARGKYTFGTNRVKIQTPFGTTVYQMELSADRMILKDPRGSRLEFTRSK